MPHARMGEAFLMKRQMLFCALVPKPLVMMLFLWLMKIDQAENKTKFLLSN